MSTWHGEERVRRERLSAVGAALAGELEGWTFEEPEGVCPRLVNGDGVKLWLSLVSYGAAAGRLEVSAGVPEGASYSDGDTHGITRPEITVSPERPAATLARDVARRLIPGAVEYWREVSDRVERRQARAVARETVARELAAAMGGQAVEVRDGWSARLPGSSPGWGGMTPAYDGESVAVELHSVPLDLAHKLAAVIAAHVGGES